MMEQPKVKRLSVLFEKVLSNKATHVERHELSALYQEYINDGRNIFQRRNSHKTIQG